MEKTNITLRKHKSKSVTDLSIIIDECNVNYSNPFDTSTLSLPNTSITENDYTKNLQRQINEQKLLLESANEEVERLSLENIDLKKTLAQRENTLSLMKKIGISENLVMSSPVIKRIKNFISVGKTPTKTNSISPKTSITQVINLENKIKKLEQELEEANRQIEKLNQNIKKLQGNVICSTTKKRSQRVHRKSFHVHHRPDTFAISNKNNSKEWNKLHDSNIQH
ncbi:unnamed protein product [Parnassius apollo]|uniref:(apollo) hypothetical protein n=1 Tax=Parnassius apollo TaxID=110799 RepID=A0A8S3WMC7_PARAO|nr:unnamed protein product [Parnassius apollo]